MGTDRTALFTSRLGRQLGLCAAVVSCSAMLVSGTRAAEPPATASPLQRLKERSAYQRFQEIRDQYFSESKKAEPALTAGPGESPAVDEEHEEGLFSRESDLQPPEPLDIPLFEGKGSRVSGSETRLPRPSIVKSVPGPYFDSPEPEPAAEQAVALPEFLQDAPPDDVSVVPPRPIAAMAELPPVPEDEGYPGEHDSIFRPITRIQPYYDYSPTSTKPNEYLCPQPTDIPEAERQHCPNVKPLPVSGSTGRNFAMINFQWLPTNLHHQPLYFQDVALERYGQRFPCGLQPFVSVGKFAVQGIGLPYQIAIDPIWRDIYPLGYYRPGDNAPELLYQIPFNLKAAAAAGGVYTGLIFLIP